MIATPIRVLCAMAMFWVVAFAVHHVGGVVAPTRPDDVLSAGRLAGRILTYGSYGIVALSLASFWLLRAEDRRLVTELRLARSGTDAMQTLALRRRERASIMVRPFRTGLGEAALWLALGDRAAALLASGRGSWFLQGGGELGRLRKVVEADLHRAAGGSAAMERATRDLLALEPPAHPEVARYRITTLVRAVLERGDSAAAERVLWLIRESADEELAPYGVWLREWFGLDLEGAWPQGDVRRALLLARNQGAHDLVVKLTDRLALAGDPQVNGG